MLQMMQLVLGCELRSASTLGIQHTFQIVELLISSILIRVYSLESLYYWILIYLFPLLQLAWTCYNFYQSTPTKLAGENYFFHPGQVSYPFHHHHFFYSARKNLNTQISSQVRAFYGLFSRMRIQEICCKKRGIIVISCALQVQ